MRPRSDTIAWKNHPAPRLGQMTDHRHFTHASRLGRIVVVEQDSRNDSIWVGEHQMMGFMQAFPVRQIELPEIGMLADGWVIEFAFGHRVTGERVRDVTSSGAQ